MDLITALIVLIVIIAIVGVIVWFVTSAIPMPQPFKLGIYALCALVVLLLILRFLLGGVPELP